MFTLDLLKGEGIPAKTRPEGILIMTVGVAVPVFAALLMMGNYMRTDVAVAVCRQDIADCDRKIGNIADAVKAQKAVMDEKDLLNKIVKEGVVASKRHTPWSPVIKLLVDKLPDSLILSKLEAKQGFVEVKQGGSDKKAVVVPLRSLSISAFSNPRSSLGISASDEVVRQFRNSLLISGPLSARLEDVKISQRVGSAESKEVVFYDIDCLFKVGM